MRTALVSLIATAAFAAAAQAQTPAAPATQPAPAAPQTTAPAPSPTPPTTAAPPSATAPATTPAPGAAPAPGATATPAAPAAEAPPTLPTTGDGATIISLVEKVCVPLVRGGNLDDIAKANAATFGFKKNRRDGSWTMPLGAGSKDYSITLFIPGANKDVCRGEVHYALNQDQPIVSAINIWSFLHQPELILQANYVAVDPDGIKRVRKSWEHLDSTSSTAINFSTWTKPDDTSLNARYSTGEIFYQERKF